MQDWVPHQVVQVIRDDFSCGTQWTACCKPVFVRVRACVQQGPTELGVAESRRYHEWKIQTGHFLNQGISLCECSKASQYAEGFVVGIKACGKTG
ncbi:hypothetical protein ColKHC_13918 [Colletotrichum higginsianum]|nr:hypothetical protein ColKHC_13918 [Colletotrichum higginsianum]